MSEAGQVFKTVWLWVAALMSVVAVAGVLLFFWMGMSTGMDVLADHERCAELLFTEQDCQQLFDHSEWASCRVRLDSFDRCADQLLPFDRSRAGLCGENGFSLTECRQQLIDSIE